MVFGITVNPLDSVVSSSFDSNEYSVGTGGEFASEVHDLNNIDINQFGNGFNKYLIGSAEDHVSIAIHLKL